MNRIKKGSIVTKVSDNRNVLFKVEKILKSSKNEEALLKGLFVRIIERIALKDLRVVDRKEVNKYIEDTNKLLEKRIYKRRNRQDLKQIKTGSILHIDGDRRYTEKSYRYYKKLGLNSIVKFVPEEKQELYINHLLSKYKPDILVITGHDGMIRKGKCFNDLYNYINSKYFINTVRKAREWDTKKELVIFAGACQSYYEALMSAGANFASSPARVLIDFADPLIVAEKIATTDSNYYVSINDIANDLRDGKDGIGGVGAKGKSRKLQSCNQNVKKM